MAQVTDKAAFKISFGEGMVLPGQLLSYADIASEPKVDLTQVRGDGASGSPSMVVSVRCGQGGGQRWVWVCPLEVGEVMAGRAWLGCQHCPDKKTHSLFTNRALCVFATRVLVAETLRARLVNRLPVAASRCPQYLPSSPTAHNIVCELRIMYSHLCAGLTTCAPFYRAAKLKQLKSA